MNQQWLDALSSKIVELDLIASWASMTGYGHVRDLCRQASAELVDSYKHYKAQLDNSTKKDLSK